MNEKQVGTRKEYCCEDWTVYRSSTLLNSNRNFDLQHMPHDYIINSSDALLNQ